MVEMDRTVLYNEITMADRDDRVIVSKCLAGDTNAWVEFVDRFSPLLFWTIKRKLNRCNASYLVNETEDIYQSLLSSIWHRRSLEQVSDRADIDPWLIVLASNLTIDYIRKRRLREKTLNETIEASIVDQNRPSPAPQTILFLDEAISCLKKKERAYLELNYMNGMKHREIAEAFNTSINSVSTIIARAKNKIRRHLKLKKMKEKLLCRTYI